MADAAVRSGPTAYANTTNNTFYTSTGLITAVRNLHITNITAADVKVSVALNGTAATAANCILYLFIVPGYSTYDWSGYMVLASGDTIQVLADTSSGVTYTMSGITF